LPAEVDARGVQAVYRLRLVDVRAGGLVAQSNGQLPSPHSTLTLTAHSDRRTVGAVQCVVRRVSRGRATLDVAAVSVHETRRQTPRTPANELFLIYGEREVDAEVTDVSVGGMRFLCSLAMEPGTEVRGMLNVGRRVFPVAALVHHCTRHGEGHTVGVEFRFLREDERFLLAELAAGSGEGRRTGDMAVSQNTPSPDDIRERLRRWAA
jgi:PilZ domain